VKQAKANCLLSRNGWRGGEELMLSLGWGMRQLWDEENGTVLEWKNASIPGHKKVIVLRQRM
jgi:hypothetical protein